jgi:hypothetical protein
MQAVEQRRRESTGKRWKTPCRSALVKGPLTGRMLPNLVEHAATDPENQLREMVDDLAACGDGPLAAIAHRLRARGWTKL